MNINPQNPESTIICPHCEAQETLALDSGVPHHFFRCKSCKAILKPRSGDCCILCSFGTRDCSSSEQNLAA